MGRIRGRESGARKRTESPPVKPETPPSTLPFANDRTANPQRREPGDEGSVWVSD